VNERRAIGAFRGTNRGELEPGNACPAHRAGAPAGADNHDRAWLQERPQAFHLCDPLAARDGLQVPLVLGQVDHEPARPVVDLRGNRQTRIGEDAPHVVVVGQHVCDELSNPFRLAVTARCSSRSVPTPRP
jgi:hypothetical protein